MKIITARFVIGIVLLVPCAMFAQGSLTPPGAPAPTFKTLQQVEPRTPISQIPIILTNSGSYYLTTNLKQTNNAAGITIATSDITIDLNGFALIGTNGPAEGITDAGVVRTNISVRNGIVRNWSIGVNLGFTGVARLEQLSVSANTSHGIQAGDATVIADCLAVQNGGHGIFTPGAEVIIRKCLVSENGLDGIRVVSSTLVVENFCRGIGVASSTNAGIRATSNRNRIENNHVTSFPNGLVVSGSGNLIFRNTTATVGTNYIIAGGNTFGPTNAIAGMVTNHPWANFWQ